jgi:hypothetical protein
MNVLNDAQMAQLEEILRQTTFKNRGLYYDLLDHFYCLTTLYMDQGLSFELSLEKALKELAPEGFTTIDQEVTFFLTFNFQLKMNKLFYSGAFLAAFGETLYVLFRSLKWPGQDGFLFMGIFALFFMLIPALIYQFRENAPRLNRLVRFRFFSGLLGIAIFGLGSAFKIFHLPAANMQIVLGTGLLAFFFFPLFFYQKYMNSSQLESKSI